MKSKRKNRPMFIATMAIVLVWLVCGLGFMVAKRSKMTLEKFNQYKASLDLGKMSPSQRAKALRDLVDKLNALSAEDHRHWPFDRDWLMQLTEEEKGWLIDATMSTELKHELNLFERMPQEKRQQAIDEAMRHMREQAANQKLGQNPNATPLFSRELEKKIRTTGLKSLYGESSAQSKAELAPLLNELQNLMEKGQLGPIGGY